MTDHELSELSEPGAPDRLLDLPQGQFDLRRHPVRDREGLRAWDAADELLLHRIAGHDPGLATTWEPISAGGATLILGDAFGTLAVALADSAPTSIVDSYNATVAVRQNLERNGRELDAVTLRTPLDVLDDLTGAVSLLVLRPPRTLALFEHLLRRVAPVLGPDSVVVGAEMVKHLHTSTLEVVERVIGPTTTSRALRKARLLEARPDGSLEPGPWSWPLEFRVEPGALRVTSWPGVFAGTRLDHGTAMLLDHLPETEGIEHIVDLGCGNGVLGTVAALDNPLAEVTFVDDSALALDAARATFAATVGADRSARFVWGNGLSDWPADEATGTDSGATADIGAGADTDGAGADVGVGTGSGVGIEPGSVGLVLTNPPFHEQRARGDAVAWQMFSDARMALRPEGELWAVGNRHLGHHAKLTRLFGNCEVVASSPKFVVLRAIRR